jgi:hypothetical protein
MGEREYSQIIILFSLLSTSTHNFFNSSLITSILLHSFRFRVFKPVILVSQGKNIAKLIKLIEISGISSKLISPTPSPSLVRRGIFFSKPPHFKIVFSQLLS